MNDSKSICGADCSECALKESCNGCIQTKGCPFEEKCIVASYIQVGGMEAYQKFKETLIDEINLLLNSLDIPVIDKLHELQGIYINLEFPIPSGQTVKLLNDNKIYLGCQIEYADLGICYGIAADTSFILICSYSVNGSQPEIILYKRR